LAGEDTDFDPCLVEAAGVFGRITDSESVPELIGLIRAGKARERTASMRAQIVQDQVNGSRAGISTDTAFTIFASCAFDDHAVLRKDQNLHTRCADSVVEGVLI
jgi:hypothetical protein